MMQLNYHTLRPYLTSTSEDIVECVEVIISVQFSLIVKHVILLHARVSASHNNTVSLSDRRRDFNSHITI